MATRLNHTTDTALPLINLKIINPSEDEMQPNLQIINGNGMKPNLQIINGDEEQEERQEDQTQQQMILKKHQLLSFEHLLLEFQTSPADPTLCPSRPRHRAGLSITGGDPALTPRQDHDSVLKIKGLDSLFRGDKRNIHKNLVHMFNKLFQNDASVLSRLITSPDSSLSQGALRGLLLALNELLDEGVLDVSRFGVVSAGQCLTITLYFRHSLTQLARQIWHSNYAQVLTDTWMSFGCLGAVALLSAMRH